MRIRFRFVLLCGVLLAGCRSTPVPTPVPAPAPPPPEPPARSAVDECLVQPPAPSVPALVALGIAATVNPTRAPVPGNDAERMVFAQMYETLVMLDCAGELRPGLAEAWSADSAGLSWTFTMRPGARFWDGAPAGAAEVLESWRALESDRGLPALTGATSAVALDERRVTVTFAQPGGRGPRALADPALSVVRRGAGWPVGTGLYRPGPEAGRLVSDAGLPDLVARRTSADARDALATGVDLIVTRDRAALEYAASRNDLRAVPLAWDRTYLLLAQPGAPWPADSGLGAGLARDAVRADSRAAAPPFWWDSVTCNRPPMPRLASPPRERVVFPRGDATAADLAGRLVALAGRRLTAVGLDGRDLAAAIRSGADRGYVVAVPRHPTAACAVAAGWPVELAVTPLVETRAHVIVRAPVPPFTRTGDGTLRFVADSAVP